MPSLKTVNQRKHAKLRAAQRYGLALNRDKYNEINMIIKNGKAQTYRKQTNRVSIVTLNYAGKNIKAAYDTHRHQVITFLY